MATLRCRPSESEKEAIMVFMSAAQMLSLKLKNGDLCSITWKDQQATAVAWLTMKPDLKEGVVGVSRWLQDRCGIKLENKVSVEKADGGLPDAESVPVRLVEGELGEEQEVGWAFNARAMVVENYRYLVSGQRFFVVVGKQKKEFEVLTFGGIDVYRVVESTKVHICKAGEVNGIKASQGITFDSIGGLHTQKHQLKRRIRQICDSDLTPGWVPLTRNARGILLWGPPRTGKTLLRQAVESEITWTNVHHWDSTTKKVPKPSSGLQLIHVEFLTRPGDQEVKALRELFQSSPPSTLILGEISNPNDLPTPLRNADTFADEIEISVPDAPARLEILSILCGNSLDPQLLQQAAAKTHGFVGGDLRNLLTEMGDQIIDEAAQEAAQENADGSNSNLPTRQAPVPTTKHLERARTKIRPSALQQVFLSKPNIKWSDIGGQSALKARLKAAVEWPLLHASALRSFGVHPPKGILLYGPPGCAKTMLVQALAAESAANFLAVKGGELISMYVGESERATREVFRKARAASPCIVFFDEIDAIARSRQGSTTGSGSGELNVLTTLLNEMDGFEKLHGVLVVAATNKPAAIDPALLRPGRFDRLVYIAPPDASARRAIFADRFARIERVSPEVLGADSVAEFVDRTDGFSGADVVAVCQTAAEIAFERALAAGDLRMDGAAEERTVGDGAITREDVLAAIARTPMSITVEMLIEYNEWNQSRGGSGGGAE